jgi:homoserine kinase
MTFAASAPASSANLGPGFDFIALALDLRCRVEVEPTDDWSVPLAASAIVQRTAAAIGFEQPLRVTIESAIPVGRGLGSSAALSVATAGAVIRANGRQPDPAVVFRAAAAVEGHPDNAAAAVYGGLVAVADAVPHRLALAPSLLAVVAVPNRTLATAEARAALPATVLHAAAARNAARAAFLVEGLRTGSAAILAGASGDELHEAPRASLSPMTADLIATALRAGALHACWSGAGPSVLAIVTEDTVDAVATALGDALADEGHVLRPAIATTGLE